MNKLKIHLFCICGGTILMMSAHAKQLDPNFHALMTVRDVQNNTLSNISISNHAGQSVDTAGLYIASYDVNDCSACFGNVTAGDNVGGTVITPVTFKPNQTLPIGQNYLYNMIYNGIYFIKQTVGSSPCSLPGCSWPGDDPNVNGWCISINVISRHSSYTYSNYVNGSNPPANAPAYAQAGNSNAFDYKYSLINPNTLGTGNACFGPIVCDDKTLTCHVNTAQNESFQPYN
jgi:hypothetical protein